MSDERKTALVVGAHPDDPDFGAGGTAALWSRDGWEFYYLVCTNGSKGSADPDMDPVKLIEFRRTEQRAAAQALGVVDCFFLDGVDGELQPTREFLGHVVRYIRTLKPDAVFTHSTEIVIRNSFINHTDHRCTGQVTLDAIYPAARDILNFPEQIADGLEPHKVLDIYIWGSNEPNFTVEIGEVADVKVDALTHHMTQFAHREGFRESVKERWKNEEGRLVETFRRVQMRG
ncbi:MAG TPA: PIG-L deacetylase family protein [Dehalococcoidia bacterium]|jgi:LmbE family N-acetylglucosaminyl deacetylase